MGTRVLDLYVVEIKIIDRLIRTKVGYSIPLKVTDQENLQFI